MKNISPLLLIFLLASAFPLGSPLALRQSRGGENAAVPCSSNNLKVQNADTGLSYSTIQEAINARETTDGHTIIVSAGVYYEHVVLNKSLALLGAGRDETIIDGNGSGVVFHVVVENVTLKNVAIQNANYGVRLEGAKNATLIGTSVLNTDWFGVELDHSGNSTLRDNQFERNTYSLGVDGTSVHDFFNNIDDSNTVNGKPVYYLLNQRDVTIDSSTFDEIGYLALINSTNISIENLTLTANKEGLLLAHVTNATVTNLVATKNWNGIFVKSSSNVSIVGNEANDNFDYGIKFFDSSNSTASNNSANDNVWSGIGLYRSHNLTITTNTAHQCIYCLHVVYSNDSRITANTAYPREDGYSIALYYSNDNLIYHNNFANGFLYTPVKSRNLLDNGYEGNYWTSYQGGDADQDGVGDSAYTLGEDNRDSHPIMGAMKKHAVAAQGQTHHIATISNATISDVQLDLTNATIGLTAINDASTTFFCRIALPNTVIQEVAIDRLKVLVNGQPPTELRHWTQGEYTYLYLTCSSQSTSPVSLILPLLAAMVLAALVYVLVIAMRRQLRDRQDKRAQESELASPDTPCARRCFALIEHTTINAISNVRTLG